MSSSSVEKEKENEKEKELPVSIDMRAGYTREFAMDAEGLGVYPQPTEDELDPLNWSRAQKLTSLGIVMWM